MLVWYGCIRACGLSVNTSTPIDAVEKLSTSRYHRVIVRTNQSVYWRIPIMLGRCQQGLRRGLLAAVQHQQQCLQLEVLSELQLVRNKSSKHRVFEKFGQFTP